MRRGLLILIVCGVLITLAFFTTPYWLLQTEVFDYVDASRDYRPVPTSVTTRKDFRIGYTHDPVVIVFHGNTIGFNEYSYIANFFALRGYEVISIQNDIQGIDFPLMTIPNKPYVGREEIYRRSEANVFFVLDQLGIEKKNLTLIGHSNGGDVALYFANKHPEMIRKVITLDNLRYPLMGKFGITSFRSKDPDFVPDPGVIRNSKEIKLIETNARHVDMSDRGPTAVQDMILKELEK